MGFKLSEKLDFRTRFRAAKGRVLLAEPLLDEALFQRLPL
jgi:hypothetical protein